MLFIVGYLGRIVIILHVNITNKQKNVALFCSREESLGTDACMLMFCCLFYVSRFCDAVRRRACDALYTD